MTQRVKGAKRGVGGGASQHDVMKASLKKTPNNYLKIKVKSLDDFKVFCDFSSDGSRCALRQFKYS